MANKIITDTGKTELLRLAFKSEERGAFNYLALGGEGSGAAQGKPFVEVSGSNYERVQTEIDNTEELYDQKQIIISGTFDETNYAPDNGGRIKEIGLCNSERKNEQDETFFMYSEVPEIDKTGDISLKYTIIISIE